MRLRPWAERSRLIRVTLNWGFLAQQALMAGLAFALGAAAVAGLRALCRDRRDTPLRLLVELPTVGILLAAAGTYCMPLGFGFLLPGPVLPWTVGVALAFYWLAVVWPLRIARRRAALAGAPLGRTALCTAAALALGACYSLFIEPQLLDAEPRLLHVADVGAREIRVAHVSDLQLVDRTPREDALVVAVNAFDPHLIVLTGDYIAGSMTPEPAIAAARDVLSRLRASHGIFATTSDSDTEAQRRRIFAGLPVRYLLNRNETVAVEGVAVRVGCIDHYRPDLVRMAQGARAEELFIVACHTPDIGPATSRNVPLADLYLCGHTHGGQVQVPFFGPLLTFTEVTPRRMAGGGVFHSPRGLPVVVSRGVGMEGSYAPRFRFFCPPHLFLLTLRGGGGDRRNG